MRRTRAFCVPVWPGGNRVRSSEVWPMIPLLWVNIPHQEKFFYFLSLSECALVGVGNAHYSLNLELCGFVEYFFHFFLNVLRLDLGPSLWSIFSVEIWLHLLVAVWGHACHGIYVRGQRTNCKSQFSPFTQWALQTELRSSALVAGTLPSVKSWRPRSKVFKTIYSVVTGSGVLNTIKAKDS